MGYNKMCIASVIGFVVFITIVTGEINPTIWWNKGSCNACTFIDDCQPVQQILQSQYTQKYSFFYSISCDFYIGGVPLVCCDFELIQKILIESGANIERNYIMPNGLTQKKEHSHIYDDSYYLQLAENSLPQHEMTNNNIVGNMVFPEKEITNVATGVDSVVERLEAGPQNITRLKVNDAICGSNTEFRIIGGEQASAGMFPWMARLGYRARGDSVNGSAAQVSYRCAGALITVRHVLTAAHCLLKLPVRTFLAQVKLGTEGAPTQTFAPESTLSHPEYDRPKFQNDIAMVRLNRSAIFTDTIMPICLPFGEFSMNLDRLPVRAMIVAGWGSNNADSTSLSPTLQYIRLTHLMREECARIYSSRFNVTIGPSQICTIGENARDSCGGDSGGPVFVWETSSGGGARAVGIVSFGARRCGTQGVPTVYTKVDAYQRWIEEAVANLS